MASEFEVTKVMLYMSVYYPGFIFRETTPEQPGTSKAYAMMLQDIQYDALYAAAQSLVTTNKWFPSLAELRQKALDIILAKSGLPSAYEAWEEVLRMGDGSPEKHCKPLPGDPNRYYIETIEKSWKHPLIETVALRCGWPAFPDPESLSYDRDTFIKAYNDHVRREDEEMRTPELVKVVEQKYIDAGDKIKSLATGMGGK